MKRESAKSDLGLSEVNSSPAPHPSGTRTSHECHVDGEKGCCSLWQEEPKSRKMIDRKSPWTLELYTAVNLISGNLTCTFTAKVMTRPTDLNRLRCFSSSLHMLDSMVRPLNS